MLPIYNNDLISQVDDIVGEGQQEIFIRQHKREIRVGKLVFKSGGLSLWRGVGRVGRACRVICRGIYHVDASVPPASQHHRPPSPSASRNRRWWRVAGDDGGGGGVDG